MTRSRKNELDHVEQGLDAFEQQIEIALERFADAPWLGTHSPLAAPYFLGSKLAELPASETVVERGRSLQAALQSSAAQLAPELRELLQVAFFRRNPYLTSEGMAQALHISRRTFYRTRHSAIQALAYAFNQSVVPPLRLEKPIHKPMTGRGQILAHSLLALRTGRSVYLHGPSGSGKTTLAAMITQEWNLRPPLSAMQGEANFVFWYTVRANFNDQFASFAFALGYFLRSCGVAHTWRQLVADKGIVNAERTLGLLRYDLAALPKHAILLCIDEIDALQSERQEHAQMLYLIEESSRLTSVLLIGQRQVLESAETFTLNGFTSDELTQFLHQSGLDPLSSEQHHELLERTRGNPALLTLLTGLLRSGDPLDDLLQQLNAGPSMEALFNRIWRRLQWDERLMLMRLAVFRSAAPVDAWTGATTTLMLLLQRELVQIDNQGGVLVLPHLHKLVYDYIPAEDRSLLHREAAEIREKRGEYLAAIYHAIQSKTPAWAVWLWFTHREQAIERGQGTAALSLLNAIDATELPDERDRSALRIGRAELLKLAGKAEAAESELDQVAMPRQGALHAYVRELQGDIAQMGDRIEHGLQRYREGLQALVDPSPMREVTLHTKIAFPLAFRQGDFTAARREALWALAKAASSYGNIEEWFGNLTIARHHYQQALDIVEQLEDQPQMRSRIYSYIGSLTLKQGYYTAAIDWMKKAIACDQLRGDSVSPLYDQINLVYAYTLAQQFTTAYQHGKESLARAEQFKHSYLIAGLAVGVGEACYYLGNYAEAEHYVIQSLGQEELFFRPWALTVLGSIYGKTESYAKAIMTLQSAITTAAEIADKYGEAYAWRKLGDLHREQQHQQAAQNAYSAALQHYTQLGLSRECTELEQVMGKR